MNKSDDMRTIFQAPTGIVCGIVQDQHKTFVVQWGSAATTAEAGQQQQQNKPKLAALPDRLLRRFDPETATKPAEIKQMEAALRRKEIAEAEAKRLADKHQRVMSARISNRTRRVVNLVNDLELL